MHQFLFCFAILSSDVNLDFLLPRFVIFVKKKTQKHNVSGRIWTTTQILIQPELKVFYSNSVNNSKCLSLKPLH